MADNEAVLWQDVQAAAKFSNEVAVPEPAPVAHAIERGTRYHPTGVVEEYQRVEFD